MYKVMCIFGTRPEAIKMAPVIHAIEQHPQLQGIVCISAQHREMLDSVLETFKIKPDHDLNIMKHGQDIERDRSGPGSLILIHFFISPYLYQYNMFSSHLCVGLVKNEKKHAAACFLYKW